MADTFIRLPDDAALTGKKVRTQEITVGANLVHQHYFTIVGEDGTVYGIPTSALPVEAKSLDLNTVSETRTTVSTSSVTILAANSARQRGMITNSGTSNVWVTFTSPAAASGANLGHRLFPGGSMPVPDGYDGNVYAISDVGASSQNVIASEFEA